MNNKDRMAWSSSAALLLASILIPAAGCSAERPLRTANSCSGVCGTAADFVSGEPVTRFTVAVFSKEEGGRLQPAVDLPEGFPAPPGRLVVAGEIDSAEGWFDLAPGHAGPVIVVISARGYEPLQIEATFAPAAPLRIRLRPARQAVLQVTDERGRPLRDARIYLGGQRTLMELHSGVAVTPLGTTAADGEIALDVPLRNGVEIVVARDAYASQLVRVAAGDRSRTVRLAPATSIAGVTRTAAGRAAGGAAIAAHCGGLWFYTLSDTRGAFRIDAVPRARCSMTVGYALVDDAQRRSLRVAEPSSSFEVEAGSSDVIATLPPAGMVSGRLTGIDRRDVGYRVTAGSRDRLITFQTDAAGRFSGRIGAGTWQFTGATSDGSTTETKTVVVQADGEAEVELAFAPPTIIRIVPSENVALPLRVRTTDSRSGIDRLVRPEGHEYRLRGLRNGTYVGLLEVSGTELSFPFMVPSAEPLELSLPLHTATVRVKGGRQEPLRASITVLSHHPSEGSPFRSGRPERMLLGLARDGEYVGWHFPAGRYEIRVDAEGYLSRTASFELPGPAPDLVLETIPNPFPHPEAPAALPRESVKVITATLRDLHARAAAWRADSDVDPVLLVASDTVRHPADHGVAVGNAAVRRAYEELGTTPLLQKFHGARGAVRSIDVATAEARTVPFRGLPLQPPAAWNEAVNESDMIDTIAFFETRPRALALALYSDVTYSDDGASAVVLAELLVPGATLPRLYVLEKRAHGWEVEATFDVTLEPGC